MMNILNYLFNTVEGGRVLCKLIVGYWFLSGLIVYSVAVFDIGKKNQELYFKDLLDGEAILVTIFGGLIAPIMIGSFIFNNINKKPIWRSKKKQMNEVLYEDKESESNDDDTF